MDKIFDLVPIYKEIDKNAIAVDYKKYDHLGEIISSLGKLGYFSKAYELVNEITNEELKLWAFKQVTVEQAKAGKFNEAIKKAKELPDEQKEVALKEISLRLSEAGEFYKAIQLAHTIRNGGIKDRAFWGISKELCKAGKFDQAVVMTYAISIDDEVRNYALGDTAVALAKAGRFDEALKLANTIGEDGKKEETLKIISIEQAKAGKFDEAIKTAKTISDAGVKSPIVNDTDLWPSRRAGAYKEISLELSKVKRFDEAIKLAKTISDEYWRIQTLKKISAEMDIANDNANKSV